MRRCFSNLGDRRSSKPPLNLQNGDATELVSCLYVRLLITEYHGSRRWRIFTLTGMAPRQGRLQCSTASRRPIERAMWEQVGQCLRTVRIPVPIRLSILSPQLSDCMFCFPYLVLHRLATALVGLVPMSPVSPKWRGDLGLGLGLFQPGVRIRQYRSRSRLLTCLALPCPSSVLTGIDPESQLRTCSRELYLGGHIDD
jgi:hypothetical protein